MNYFAFVSYAEDGDVGVFRLDCRTRSLTPLDRYPAADRVMPLALSADQSPFVAGTRWLPALPCSHLQLTGTRASSRKRRKEVDMVDLDRGFGPRHFAPAFRAPSIRAQRVPG